jgi:hypothetical protein
MIHQIKKIPLVLKFSYDTCLEEMPRSGLEGQPPTIRSSTVRYTLVSIEEQVLGRLYNGSASYPA